MGYVPRSRIDAVVHELVVGQGWGMRGDQARLRADPADGIEAFIDELFRVDGRDPRLADKRERRVLRRVAWDWIFDPDGRGARSGLPRSNPPEAIEGIEADG